MHHSVNSYMIDLWSTQEKESSKIENHEKFQSLQQPRPPKKMFQKLNEYKS